MELKFGNPTVGDALRALDLPSTASGPQGPDQWVGRPVVLVFLGSEKIVPGQRTLEALKASYEQFKKRGVTVAAVLMSPIEALQAFAQEQQFSFPLLSDAKIQASTLYGALRPPDPVAAATGNDPATPAQPGQVRLRAIRRTFLVRPSMHIAAIYDDPDPEKHVEQLLGDIDALLFREPPRLIVTQAPVLLIPDIFPPEFCRRLIETWHNKGNEDSGFMKQIDGQTVGMLDYGHKIRRDHFLKDGPETDLIKKYMGGRIIPRIKMAYNYDVSRFEDFRIASYDASRGGYFRPHRDNTTEGTAHRRFAMSLLLNDDYEGGALRFPEFGLNEYRPAAGSAVVFSCSLLHEAMDVTKGQRFVLLSFFYGEEEAKIRQEYNMRTGGTYRA